MQLPSYTEQRNDLIADITSSLSTHKYKLDKTQTFAQPARTPHYHAHLRGAHSPVNRQ